MKRYALTLLCWLTWSAVQAQLILGGSVVSEQNLPLAGVKLTVQGTSTSTSTQSDGSFNLPTDQPLPLTLLVSRTGYAPERVRVRNSNFRAIEVRLKAEVVIPESTLSSASEPVDEQAISGVTVETIRAHAVANSPALSPADALQYTNGVDLLTSSFLFKSVNMRGFGSTTNGRVVQLIDGMDNRSPGLGFGFGNVAGLPDLDVETIEVRPGASSAQHGPDAILGLMQTTSKSPFDYQGLSVQARLGANNVGKPGFGPKMYSDYGFRYALALNERFAIKVNFQRLTGTDFIADDYADRSTTARPGFFATDAGRSGIATGITFRPGIDPNTSFDYDGVNIYGDDVNNGGVFRYPATYANTTLQNQFVTRTGYRELDVLGNQGKVFNNRANASVHYRFGNSVEASLGWYFGNGNLIETSAFRNYIPDYRRHQFKAELKGDNFYIRAYTTQQQAEGWNIGQTARAINDSWKSLNQWATEFGLAYVENKVSIGDARFTANRGRYLPGSVDFNRVRNAFATTFNTDSIPGLPRARGLRFRDNSQLWHYEGMYTVAALSELVELTVGASFRRYVLASGGTLFARQANGSEYTIDETGGYVQAAKTLALGAVTIRPLLAVRYDKNQFVNGGFTPRASVAVQAGIHVFRASWQSAFRNPSPQQLFGLTPAGIAGDVGGLRAAYRAAGLDTNRAYRQSDAVAYQRNPSTATTPQSLTLSNAPLQTETVRSWEVGYKALINGKLAIDASFFSSRYTNLITPEVLYQPLSATAGATALLTPASYRTLLLNRNSPNDFFVRGASVSLDYNFARGYTLSGNFTHQVGLVTLRNAAGAVRNDLSGAPIVQRSTSDPAVTQLGRTYFNSPANRYTITLSNPYLTNRLGIALAYRWTDRMWYEQGITQGDVWVPAWGSIDAQFSCKLPEFKSVLKLGGTNLFNTYYAQGYGLARVGAMYYVSLTFDELFK